MSQLPTDLNELTALAGEYVLGTLDARQARMIEQALPGHPDLAALVEAWEDRLAPLTALATPEAPPPGLWDRIEAEITPIAAPAPVASAGTRFLRLWQGWAVGASLAAAVLAVIAFLPNTPEPRMMTVLVSNAAQTAWTAEVDRQGGLRLAALSAPGGAPLDTAPEGNRVLQMWALPPGAKAPTSLGLVPRGSGSVRIAAPAVKPVAGMLIEISLEPPGGAPGALPTGPVLFIGRLSEAGPPT
jgi:anti-sigma-K factor RskA